MKNINKKLLSAILSVSMIAGTTAINLPLMVSATNEMTITVSLEGLTLGQGLYYGPETYTLSEINEILSTEGYSDFTEDTINAGMSVLAFMIDNDIEYQGTGSFEDGDIYINNVYIDDANNIDVNVPDIILENNASLEITDNDDDWLGSLDYTEQSGWMVSVNNMSLPTGMCDWNLKQDYDGYNNYDNNYVIRMEFTISEYGADIGFQGWPSSAYFERANKDELYMEYAKLSSAGTLDDNPDLKSKALSVIEKLDATQEEVDTATSLLENVKLNTIIDDTLTKLSDKVTDPTYNNEWTILPLARSGYFDKDSEYFKTYYSNVVDSVNEKASSIDNNGALHKSNLTENSRVIIALSSIGKDAHSVGDWDITAPLEDYDAVIKQGLNGPVYALIALDSHNYETTTDSTIRQKYVDFILDKELENGGWTYFGDTADADMTSMAIQALSNYMDNDNVKSSVEKAIEILSESQQSSGGYASWGSESPESVAQVIVACTSVGIDPHTDSRFIKNGNSAIDALLEYYDESLTEYTFHHTLTDSGNAMATNQASYALVSYQRFLNNQNKLYDMTDVEFDNETNTLFGDANCDGIINISDAVFILQSLANPDEYSLSENGIINSDIVNTGDGVTSIDALAVQMMITNVIKDFPLTSEDIEKLQ